MKQFNEESYRIYRTGFYSDVVFNILDGTQRYVNSHKCYCNRPLRCSFEEKNLIIERDDDGEIVILVDKGRNYYSTNALRSYIYDGNPDERVSPTYILKFLLSRIRGFVNKEIIRQKGCNDNSTYTWSYKTNQEVGILKEHIKGVVVPKMYELVGFFNLIYFPKTFEGKKHSDLKVVLIGKKWSKKRQEELVLTREKVLEIENKMKADMDAIDTELYAVRDLFENAYKARRSELRTKYEAKIRELHAAVGL